MSVKAERKYLAHYIDVNPLGDPSKAVTDTTNYIRLGKDLFVVCGFFCIVNGEIDPGIPDKIIYDLPAFLLGNTLQLFYKIKDFQIVFIRGGKICFRRGIVKRHANKDPRRHLHQERDEKHFYG